MALLIHNASVITPSTTWEQGWLLAQRGKIEHLGESNPPETMLAGDDGMEVIDAGGLTLIPGFIDVHVHGGVDYDTMDAAPEGLRAVAKFYAEHGVTGFLPTTWTDSRENIMAALEVIAELQGPQPEGAAILGAHLEGPYLNVKKCGAQHPQHIRIASREEALAFLDLDVIRLLALAPEFSENHWLIEECRRRGIVASAAHTTATYEQIKEAVVLGLSHATHTYNAMIGLGHRAPGTVGAVLTTPEIRCELIADTIHVHPAAMQILLAAKGADGVILITDAMRAAGMPDGEYQIDNRVVVVRDGAVRLPDGTLAGSTLTMERALYNLMQASGQPLEAIWQTSSLNAARSLQIADRKGCLEIGKDADLTLVDGDINVFLTVVEGEIVYRRDG